MSGSITPVNEMRRQLTRLHAIHGFESGLRDGQRDFSYREIEFPQAFFNVVGDVNDYTSQPDIRKGLKLKPVDFRHSILRRITASGIILPYTLFNQGDLTEAEFSESDLTGAVFGATDINGADFSEAILDEADFRRVTNLERACGFGNLGSYNRMIVSLQDVDSFVRIGLDRRLLDIR